MSWSGLDVAIVAIIAFSAFVGFSRGTIREFFSLLAWLFALLLAGLYAPQFAQGLAGYISHASVRYITGFSIIFVLVLIVGSLLGSLISSLISGVALGMGNRLLGTVLGLMRGFLVVSFMLMIMLVTGFSQSHWWKHSLLVPKFKEPVHVLTKLMKPSFKHINKRSTMRIQEVKQ